MRLLHTASITLYSFDGDDNIPRYVILSHTWGDAEVSFQDLLTKTTSELDKLEGYSKIRSCCALAARQGYDYVWIDTCCIDKTSSAELSEAINSMYRWYHEARDCYAYLADVRTIDLGPSFLDGGREFRESKWFTRGWTLQELLAPKRLTIYGSDWQELGSRSKLQSQISRITGIQTKHMFDINNANVAQKMSWASKRKTRRVEDIAYSLMGIFDVNMPLLYGEGTKAFMRLQHEIVKISDDESIFAWVDDGLLKSGMFAQSPKAFAQSGNVVRISDSHFRHIPRTPYTVTNKGLAIEIFTSKETSLNSTSDLSPPFVQLNCRQELGSDAKLSQPLAIQLENISRDEFFRSSPGHLSPVDLKPTDVNIARMIYVRPLYIPYDDEPHSFIIRESSLMERGLSFADTYECQPKRYSWYAQPDKKGWEFRLQRNQTLAAVLLKIADHPDRPRFGVIFHVVRYDVVYFDLIVPPSKETFHKEMDEYKLKHSQRCSPSGASRATTTRASVTLQDGIQISLELRSEKVKSGKGRRHHVVHFV